MVSYDLLAGLSVAAADLGETLDDILPRPNGQIEQRLYQAMRYSTLGDGKRLRPFGAEFRIPVQGIAPFGPSGRGCC